MKHAIFCFGDDLDFKKIVNNVITLLPLVMFLSLLWLISIQPENIPELIAEFQSSPISLAVMMVGLLMMGFVMSIIIVSVWELARIAIMVLIGLLMLVYWGLKTLITYTVCLIRREPLPRDPHVFAHNHDDVYHKD